MKMKMKKKKKKKKKKEWKHWEAGEWCRKLYGVTG